MQVVKLPEMVEVARPQGRFQVTVAGMRGEKRGGRGGGGEKRGGRGGGGEAWGSARHSCEQVSSESLPQGGMEGEV